MTTEVSETSPTIKYIQKAGFKYPNLPLLHRISEGLHECLSMGPLCSVYESLNDEQRFKVDFQEMFYHLTMEDLNDVFISIAFIMKEFPYLFDWIRYSLEMAYFTRAKDEVFDKIDEHLRLKYSIWPKEISVLTNLRFENVKPQDIGLSWPNGELEGILLKDDEERLRDFTNQFLERGIFEITLRSAALVGATKCFKYSLMCWGEDVRSIENIMKFAVIGESLDIIHILEQKGIDFDQESMKAALSYHHWEVFNAIYNRTDVNITDALDHWVVARSELSIYCDIEFVLKKGWLNKILRYDVLISIPPEDYKRITDSDYISKDDLINDNCLRVSEQTREILNKHIDYLTSLFRPIPAVNDAANVSTNGNTDGNVDVNTDAGTDGIDVTVTINDNA